MYRGTAFLRNVLRVRNSVGILYCSTNAMKTSINVKKDTIRLALRSSMVKHNLLIDMLSRWKSEPNSHQNFSNTLQEIHKILSSEPYMLSKLLKIYSCLPIGRPTVLPILLLYYCHIYIYGSNMYI